MIFVFVCVYFFIVPHSPQEAAAAAAVAAAIYGRGQQAYQLQRIVWPQQIWITKENNINNIINFIIVINSRIDRCQIKKKKENLLQLMTLWHFMAIYSNVEEKRK